MISQQNVASMAIQFIKFGIVGVFGFIVDSSALTIALKIFGLNPYAAAIVAFPCAATATWVGNRLFTFRDRRAAQGAMKAEWGRFMSVTLVGFLVNRGTYAGLITLSPTIYTYPILGLVGGTLVGMFINFFLSRRFVFR